MATLFLDDLVPAEEPDGGGDLRPSPFQGDATTDVGEESATAEAVEEAGGAERAVEAVVDDPATQALAVRAPAPGDTDAVLSALRAVSDEMADRDEELRAVLARLGELYQGIAGAVSAGATSSTTAADGVDGHLVRTVLRSVDSLATVTEASIDRTSDVTRSVQRLAEAMHGLATRVDRLVRRADESEAKLDRVVQLSEAVSDQVGMIGRRLGTDASRPRPALRAVAAPHDAAEGRE